MSDLDNLEDILSSAGLVESCEGTVSGNTRVFQRQSRSTTRQVDSRLRVKDAGRPGSFCEFSFDSEGKLISISAWE